MTPKQAAFVLPSMRPRGIPRGKRNGHNLTEKRIDIFNEAAGNTPRKTSVRTRSSCDDRHVLQ